MMDRIRVLNMNLLKVSSEQLPDRLLVAMFKTDPEVNSEVTVWIEDFGELRVVHGGVIVASAKAAGVKHMWVDVGARSEAWMNFRALMLKAYDGTEMDQELFHPDFADWHVNRGTGRRLRELLKDLGDINDKVILVLDSGMGFFCHELAKRGARVLGFEPSEDKVLGAEYLSKVYGMKNNPAFIHGDFMEKLMSGTRYHAIFWPGPDWTMLLTLQNVVARKKFNASAVLDKLVEHTDRLYVELEPNKLSREMSDPSWPVKHSKWEAWKLISIYDWPLLRYRRRRKVSRWTRLLEFLRLRSPEDLELTKPRKCERCGEWMKFNPCGGFWWCECQMEV